MAFLLQHGGAGTEANFNLVGALVLVEILHDVGDRLQMSAGLLGGLVRHLSAVGGIDGVLIGEAGVGVGALDACGSAGVHILQHPGIARRELIEFIGAVANRGKLALHILFTRKRIQMSPEAFAGVGLERLKLLVRIGHRRVDVGGCLRLGSRLLIWCGAALLGNNRQGERGNQGQGKQETVLHLTFLRRE